MGAAPGLPGTPLADTWTVSSTLSHNASHLAYAIFVLPAPGGAYTARQSKHWYVIVEAVIFNHDSTVANLELWLLTFCSSVLLTCRQ